MARALALLAAAAAVPAIMAAPPVRDAAEYTAIQTAGRGEMFLELTPPAIAELEAQGFEVSGDSAVYLTEGVLEILLQRDGAASRMINIDGRVQASGGPLTVSGAGAEIAVGELTLSWTRSTVFLGYGDLHPLFAVAGEPRMSSLLDGRMAVELSIGMARSAQEFGIDPEAFEDVVGQVRYVDDVHEAIDRPSAPPAPFEQRRISGLNPGPDVIVGSLPFVHHWTPSGAVEGKHAYSVGTTSCNLGSQPLNWYESPSQLHPVIAQNMYRLHEGRFEQVGQSWLKHGFCALQQDICGTCTPVGPCCCPQLGPGCSDPYAASRNGSWGNLGPRSEVNPHTGVFPANHAFSTGNTLLRGRIVIPQADLQLPGASYFVEGQYVSQDDAQFGAMVNDNNNASYRRVLVQESFNIVVDGPTFRELPAVYAWQQHDPEVTIVPVDVPGDGRFILAYKVSPIDGGAWHYEYALHNLNSDRGAASFAVELGTGVQLANIGFHDVDYHSGEPFASEDWPSTVDPYPGSGLMWQCEPFAANTNANALRWGTLYNFRFDANSPPVDGVVRIGLFKPGSPTQVQVAAAVPALLGPFLVHDAGEAPHAEHAFSGYIDPRLESDNSQDFNQGLDRVTLHFNEPVFGPGGTELSASNFEITESGGGAPPQVAEVDASANPVVTVVFNRRITPQAWTTIRVVGVENAAGIPIDNLGNLGTEDEPDRLDLGFLPGDLTQNGISDAVDLLYWRQLESGVAQPEQGALTDYADIDRDGFIRPLDFLRLRQLLNGTGPTTRPWGFQSINAPRP